MVYINGVRPGAKSIANLLASRVLTPTRVSILIVMSTVVLTNTFEKNAFSERLSPHGFDFHSMFVVDLMHEFELGV
jgi:hypothetical protein